MVTWEGRRDDAGLGWFDPRDVYGKFMQMS